MIYNDNMKTESKGLRIALRIPCIIAIAAVIWASVVMAEQKQPGQAFNTDRMGIEGGYFSCSFPADWARNDDEQRKGDGTYQVLLIGPRVEDVPVMIFVSYFGPENNYFLDYVDFVQRNTWDYWEDEVISEAREIMLNGNKALWFERERKTYLHPESKSSASVMIKEKFYVLLSRDSKGFFVINYSAPSSVYAEYLPVFEKVAYSFKLL
jgi:hypothetical protein